MELRQLATFIRVAQFKSFSRAAESLGYSQSAVTVQPFGRAGEQYPAGCGQHSK